MKQSSRDPDVLNKLDELLRLFGADPDAMSGQLVREIMQSALRLIGDEAHTGELKLISRSLRELRYAMTVFRPYTGQRKISIFGSARTPFDHHDYDACRRFARAMAEHEWMIITGAGDGIMRAGHEGAGRDKSFGVSIRLPFETNANDIIAGDDKLVTFRYFFTRKLMFVSQADALALFPGGFGTLDEAFEVITLIQTGKAPIIPVVMVEPPESDYFAHLDVYIRDTLLARKLISPEDLHLYHLFNDPIAAAQHVVEFYRNYHSSRYVGDQFVIRMRHALDPTHLEQLNAEFGDLVASGRIEQTGALEGESVETALPRLSFHFVRRKFGRLRLLIDRINQFAPGA
ncbi:MAG: LOG family protein [Planctomycetes bacterium]|nr:LOG family protein [Planctomycetota bacterium]